MNINKLFIVFLILLLGVGFVSASDDISYNGTDVLSVEAAALDGDDLSLDANSNEDILSAEGAGLNGEDLGSDDSALNGKDILSASDAGLNDEVLVDDEPIFDFDNESNDSSDFDWDEYYSEYEAFMREYYPELFNGSSNKYPWLDLSCGNASEIITSNITQYGFNDAYRVKVVDDDGRPVFVGKVDFYVDHVLVGSSLVDYSGVASFDLASCIDVAGDYTIVSVYSVDDGSDPILARQDIGVSDLKMADRDIQVYCENIKLYDLGEYYCVKVVDKAGAPVTKGYVVFIVYDRVFYCDLSDSGVAGCVLPLDLNFTGNLLVWSVYSDGDLYDLAVSEQISIGTRTLASLDSTSLGSRLLTRWNSFSFVYEDGKYVAPIGGGISLVRELSGKTYTRREVNVGSSTDLQLMFAGLSYDMQYDVVVLNLVADKTYTVDLSHYSDQEWDYACRFGYGQLIVNGNGATIMGDHDLNFMFVGSDANVNFFDVNITNFDHCFVNYGNLLCRECVFEENEAYSTDVKLWGSGAVVHNYNTVFFEDCGFFRNNAKYDGLGTTHMGASILYAEPYSVNIFKDMAGEWYGDSFYCESYTTTIIYANDYKRIYNSLSDSEIAQDAYFAVVRSDVFSDGGQWVVNVSDSLGLMGVFFVLNTCVNASDVVINLAPGSYDFSTGNYSRVRGVNWRSTAWGAALYVPSKHRYLLDVGFCPVTINGNGAVIDMGGNDDNDDYHFAFIGKYGVLTLNDLELKDFNTALYVTGSVYANNVTFRDNDKDNIVQSGDLGGAFRSFGGSVVCSDCRFIDNTGDEETNDFYAGLSSYVEFRNCSAPEGRLEDSYLKCSLADKRNVNLKGDSIFEDAFEDDFEEVDFVVFNVSDDASYNSVFDYLRGHTVYCLFINFTGDYEFAFSRDFDCRMSVVFQNNGFDVGFKEMEIKKSNTFTFINFNFEDVKIVNKGSATFINCSIFGKDGGDYALKNEGSCTLLNCRLFDNDCDDAVIHSTGSLVVYDSVFWDNLSDEDDLFEYGVIYNEGGSVTCMNTTFGDRDYHIYNFASGNCAVVGNMVTNVEFDHPWSNFKTGLMKGAFLLGTAIVTFGAGEIAGVLAPAVSGLIVASVTGAGIGFGGGLCYGLLEGEAFHDYSNLWRNVLSFTLLGLGMGQSGFSFGSAWAKQLNDALNNQPGAGFGGDTQNPQGTQGSQGSQGASGSQGSQGASGSQGGGHGSLDVGYQDSAFRNVIEQGIDDLLFNLKPMQDVYPEVYGHYVDVYASMAANPRVTVLDMISFYNGLFDVLVSFQMLFSPPNPQANPSAGPSVDPSGGSVIPDGSAVNRIEIVNRVNNNVNGPGDGLVVAGEHFVHPFAGMNLTEAALVHGYAARSSYLEHFIANDRYLSYLSGFFNLATYYGAMLNVSHTNRALVLLHNYAYLYEQVHHAGLTFMTAELDGNLRFYLRSIGRMGRPNLINALFNPNSGVIETWEHFYQMAVEDFNVRLNQTGLREFMVPGSNYDVDVVLNSTMANLVADLDARVLVDDYNYQYYLSLRNCYLDNFVRSHMGDIDLMWHVFNLLRELNDTVGSNVDVDVDDYNSMVSFDFVDVIRDNVYNGIFNHPNYIAALNDMGFSSFFTEDMQLLQIVNPSLYDDISNRYFSKSEFDDIKLVNATLHAEIMALYSNHTEFDAWLEGIMRLHKNSQLSSILCNKYAEIHNSLSSYRTAVIKERDIIFYQIRMGLNNYNQLLKSYKLLSDSDKVMVNKYLYDQSYELIKTFNGLYYMHALMDYTENLTLLRNIHNVSDNYFMSLIEIYSAVVSSRNINALFKKNITNLNAGQISDILLNELPQYYLTTFGCNFEEGPDLRRSLMLRNVVKYAHWGKVNAVDNLTEVYNWLVYYREQYELFYKLDYNFRFLLPLDWDMYSNFTWYKLNRAYLANEFTNGLGYVLAPYVDIMHMVVYGAQKFNPINNLPSRANIVERFKEYEGAGSTHFSNLLAIWAFNQYLKINVTQLNISVIDLYIDAFTNIFYVNQVYGFEYYDNITRPMPSREVVLNQESNINPAGKQKFITIDVSEFNERLLLFKEVCPVGYWLLMDYCNENFGYPVISFTTWKFSNNHQEFYILDKQRKAVTYYEFCNLMLDQMKYIIDSLGVFDGNDIIFRSDNYSISRLMDLSNRYNNIFNKRGFFERWANVASYDDIKLLIDEMEHDLIYLRNTNRTLYHLIMRDIFDGASDFNDWMDKYILLSPSDLFKKYDAIYNRLSEYRDSSRVSDNEINAIINQLDINTLKYLSADAQQEVRSRLLYFIFFWELYHDKISNEVALSRDDLDPNEAGRLSIELLNKPLEDIFKRYLEVVNHVTFHVFDDDVDIASLKIDGMRNLLINNLYRAYHAPNRFSVVFDILDERGIHFDSFIGYENYINSIVNEDELIDLYDAIRSRVVPYRANVGPDPNLYPNPYAGPDPNFSPNPYAGSNPSHDSNPIPGSSGIPFTIRQLSGFRDLFGAQFRYSDNFEDDWHKVMEQMFPEISDYIVTNLMGGNLQAFLIDNFYGDPIDIVDKYLEKLISDLNPNLNPDSNINPNPNPNLNPDSNINPNPDSNPNSNQNTERIISFEDFYKMKSIILDKVNYPDEDNIYNLENSGDIALCYFWGAWNKFVKDYPEISAMVVENLMGGNVNRFIESKNSDYNRVRNEIVDYLQKLYNSVPSGNSNPVPAGNSNPVPAGNSNPLIPSISLSSEIVDDIVSIMENRSISDNPDYYDEVEMELCNVSGSWKLVCQKYPEISQYILNNLLGGDFEFYTLKLGWGNMDNVRKIIIDYVKKLNLNPPVIVRNIILSDEEFNEIKNIMLNESIYPKKVHYVVSDYFTRLYGSWDLIEEKYPAVAINIKNNLFGPHKDLFYYAYFTGDSSIGYRDVRQRILGFIQEKCYDGFMDHGEDSLKINGKKVSDCSVDEVYTYVMNQIFVKAVDINHNRNLAESLLNDANGIFDAYVQYVDLMVRSGISEAEYKKQFGQFKDNLLNILNIFNANLGVNVDSVLIDIGNIMNNKNLPYEGNDAMLNQNIDLSSFLGSWQNLGAKYPLIASVVFEKMFKDDYLKIFELHSSLGDGMLRKRIIDFIKTLDISKYVKVDPDSSAQNVNPPVPVVGKYIIPQKNIVNANVEDVKMFLKEAVNEADTYLQKIMLKDSPLAESLKSKIDKLYDECLVHIQGANYQWQYIKFIRDMNDLFKDIDFAKYDDPILKLKGITVKKVSTKDFTRKKFFDSMDDALQTANDFADEVAKTNHILAENIRKTAKDLYDEKVYAVNHGGYKELYYWEFVKQLNALFIKHIESRKGPKMVEDSDVKAMTNEEILNKINKTLSQPWAYPKILKDRYKELKNEKVPNRNDLIDLYNNVRSVSSSLMFNSLRLNSVKGKIIFFDSNNYSENMGLNKFKQAMDNELSLIKESLPNLYYSLKKSFDLASLKNINSLEECKQLRANLSKYCADYMKFHKIDSKWYSELQRNLNYGAFKNVLKTYFDTTVPELGFAKDLSLASADSIREYIKNEMNWLKDNNRDLYRYYMTEIFGGNMSIESFLEKFDYNILYDDERDASYQDLYGRIQAKIQPSRDLIHDISLCRYDGSKANRYIKYMADSLKINLDGKKAAFTRVLINAIRNINGNFAQFNLFNDMVNWIDAFDGSINKNVKQNIKKQITNKFSITRVLDDDEFEVLVSIMDVNLHPKVRSLLLAQYVKIINDYYNPDDNQHKQFCEYQRVLFDVLRYQALSGYKLTWYENELDVLNNLEYLRCYGILNNFLELKLNSKYRDHDISRVAMEAKIKNSIEYNVLIKNTNNLANLNHINVYYSVFNKKNLPDDFDSLVTLINDDMEKLRVNDFVLFIEFKCNLFEYNNNIRGYLISKYPNDEKGVVELRKIYEKIYKTLGNWRNNDIVETVESLLTH